MADVVIIGAGIIGCACALELAARGMDVEVVERTDFAAEAASRRAAGILGAQIESHDSEAMAALCVASRARYREWVARIEDASGREAGYRESGVLRLAFDETERERLAAEVRRQRGRGLEAELLDGAAARGLEPAIADTVQGAASFSHDAIVDPPSLLAAARAAAEIAGARFRFGVAAREVTASGGRVQKVQLADATAISTGAVVVAAGSWSTRIGGLPLPPPNAVYPARGQMLELRLDRPRFTRVLESPRAYLSPRPDGRVLVGSTVEHVGFDPAVTAGAAAALLAGALAMVPALAEAVLTATWAGFRAETPDGLPIFGSGGREGLWLATGHFRNGVLLAPLSAAIVAALVLGEPPPVDLAPFSAERFA